MLFVALLLLSVGGTWCSWNSLNIPEEHIPYHFFNNPSEKDICLQDEKCPYKGFTDIEKCWGYEEGCDKKYAPPLPECPGDCPPAWAATKEKQQETFWKEADFGYVKDRLEENSILCEPESNDDAKLECVSYMRYCKAKNLYLDFTQVDFLNSRDRYSENVFKKGQIGGHCKFYEKKLKAQGEHKSPLQSWYAEFQEYTGLNFDPFKENKCDIIYHKPVILMKLDAGVNMYHHFCDFVNLYASQHMNNSFTQGVTIVMWDTSGMNYGDFFHDTWKAFTDSPVIPLNKFQGKRVCFKDAVFSLLPRMRFGLYYNMPLIPGCHGSSLMRAFSHHVTHRLTIPQEGPLEKQIRVTLLVRSTKFRKIMNQEEIITALRERQDIKLNIVDFNMHMPFLEQLKVTHNSDIFMGMHGAGLTHMLFQPDWGSIFEIYNCEDSGCYSDLARLRGLHYMTWENMETLVQEDEGHHPQLGAHAKFTNYGFDVKEFLRMVAKGIAHVKQHPSFVKAWQSKWKNNSKDEL